MTSSVNADAPIICCTAEILANIALREGRDADVGLVVMDEFHFYAEPDRGWAWQVPLLELPQAQMLLMSATLGDMTDLAADLTRRTGRETAVVDDAERPVPLTFAWSTTVLEETLEELVATHQSPVYVVHFTQKDAVEHATALLRSGLDKLGQGERRDAVDERLAAVRFGAGFGRTLQKLLKKGIGVHHAGMLPRYRRLVEQLAQAGLLTVVCGTDTLGVGVNVPIRTVLFSGLAKYDGSRSRVLRTREFLQIAGRAGRAGFDTSGHVVVQAPEHVIANEKAKAKADGQEREPARAPAGEAEVEAAPHQAARGHRGVDRADLRQAGGRRARAAGEPDEGRQLDARQRRSPARRTRSRSLRRLLTDNHELPRQQLKLARRALRLARSLVASGTLERLDEPDEFGRRYVLGADVPHDFALNQPLAHYALEAFDLLDPEADSYTLDVVSVVEAVLDPPRQMLCTPSSTPPAARPSPR